MNYSLGLLLGKAKNVFDSGLKPLKEKEIIKTIEMEGYKILLSAEFILVVKKFQHV